MLVFLTLLFSADPVVVIAPVPPAEMTVYANDSGTFQRRNDAVRVNVTTAGPNPWSVMALSPKNTGPIAKGQPLVVSIRVAGVGGPAVLSAYAESAVDGKTASLPTTLEVGTRMRTYRRSLESPDDFAAGEFQISVHLANRLQSLAIAEIKLEAYPVGTPFDQLGADSITWDGAEPDAPWRAAAAGRINALRKADVSVRVVDPDGRPVEGATVRVEQVRHAFRFGTFVGPTLIEDSEDGRRYREVVRRRYNYLTLPAYLADWGWRDDAARQRYFEMADWAQKSGIPARGHLLVYPGWTATPPEWFELPKPELRAKIDAHIPRAVRAFEDRGVTEWDVANELRFNREFMAEIGGLTVAADWFKTARRLLPDGELFLNETVILIDDGRTETEQAVLEAQLGELLAAGAPIDGLGLQGHFGNELTPPARVLEILDRFAKFGLPILITEYDMTNDDKPAQAAYLRDFYTVLFSHPAVIGSIQWQFWQKDMWRPQGHHFTTDWQETEVAKAYEDLVLGEWWTDVTLATDAEGSSTVRAFRGRQRVTVTSGEYKWSREIDVPADGATVEISVP